MPLNSSWRHARYQQPRNPTPHSTKYKATVWPSAHPPVTSRHSFDSWAAQDTRVTAVPSSFWDHGLTTQKSHPHLLPTSYRCQSCDLATQEPMSMPKTHASSSSTNDDAADDPTDSHTATWCRLLPKTEGWFSQADLRRLRTSRSSLRSFVFLRN